ncbi:MAG: 50S ribosomal protein L13 [Candidatus Yonathbacteria bacterium CG_4_10_14_3_um_filter_47_65]|uniref:50S ribosomal protein L13 n=2 Tax=Parcubacteria group TaxID=1794811 RepID=A0A2M8D5C6_9BACT|nr:MAG: 50S ribosomal protein L13 [Candidatus Nomurabacteria bacterium CG1_02_47_685]PIP03813.1 MAG: 50S ribosomal protein L13 [Candidatus Yonathbacteria bacterium CG23_combo_of_CG06-09_8_20_14_all_46_18]PIQ32531.1 MAG: 50S ribosomal protein L13 [Candidatus Yonathbacteria bacterium CG17_big_fil_post_rev_8_21_14_2_50_46_19]PIX56427.1 MAG: 50S ribosomal protein L13 [Candidatus Yonathbacteria bacterium CG_4_10_14_3_um_filter_47_65]PIY57972.1 MAG: 50S ribosomal protein L13 [Candidatus Yonathbacteri
MDTKEFTIDAADRTIGRVASQAAVTLMGKDTPEYERNVVPQTKVHIINASKANITQKRKKEKIYVRYTGHPGGLREETMERTIEKKGHAEVFRKAVYGMVRSNKLRKIIMKNLIVTD